MNEVAASLFAGIVADKASAARRALADVPQAQHEAWFESFQADADAFQGWTLKEKLDGFRSHLGDVHYTKIARGPSLAALLETWVEGEKLAIGEKALNALMTLAAAYPTGLELDRQAAAAYFAEILIE